jgi:hypothetical protein
VEYDYYIIGTSYTETGTKSIVIPNTTGTHFIYFDATQTLQSTTTFFEGLLTSNAYICAVYWNAITGESIYVADERHGITMDGITHLHFHAVMGTQFISGLFVNGTWNPDVGSPVDADVVVDVGDGTIRDEDLQHDIVDTGGAVNVYDLEQELTPIAQIPILYRVGAGGEWNIKPADNFPFIYSDGVTFTGGSGLPPYNEFTGAVWQLTEVANNRFFLLHILATNDINHPVIGIQGLQEYQNKPQGKEAAGAELAQFSGLPFQEFTPLVTLILEARTVYTNTPLVRGRTTDDGNDYIDWRKVDTFTSTTGLYQNLWSEFIADTGSTITSSPNDTLTITGGTGISTAISGDTLTITASGSAGELVTETVEFTAAADVVISTIDVYVDVPGATLDITTTETGHIWATAQFNGLCPDATTFFNGRIMIDGVGGPNLLMRLENNNIRDNHVMARTDSPLVAGTYTVKVQLANTENTSDATVGLFAMFAESLGVPAGAPGSDGADGADGADGVDGDDGAAGPPGSGTTINVYEEGTIVPNSPFSELNFIGASVTATDAGSGRTDITVTGGADELVKISANDTTAGFLGVKIVGVTDETAITELNDGADEDLEIGLADNVILPGIESVTLPSGTLLERPGSPAAGMMRYNDTTNFMEYYNGTDWITVVGNSIGPGTLAGSIVGYHFLLSKFEYGDWLGTTSQHLSSDEVQYIMPFNAEIVAITYGCDIINSDIQLDIEIAADGDGNSNSTAYSWTINDARVARISTLTGAGGPGGIALTAGTKVGIVTANPGGGTAPNDIVVSLYIQWTDEVEEDDVENYAGNFS